MDHTSAGSERTKVELLELYPDRTPAGKDFNIQPDGRSALAVRCRNATAGTRIVVGGVGLPTLCSDPELLTAFVPSELYRQPGQVEVLLRDRSKAESNRLAFTVLGDTATGEMAPAARSGVGPHRARPSLLILVLHFGSWPEWFPLFLETCRSNPTIDWLIVNDCKSWPTTPPNVRLRRDSLSDLARRAHEKLGYAVPIDFAYKLCDLRLAFGRIFDDLVQPYDFFGWSDLDVIYGDVRRLIEPEALENDVITFHEHHVSGHLTLVRNSLATKELHLQIPEWKNRVSRREYQHLDEPPPDLLRRRFPVWAEQSYNTPLSPYVPWRDGTFDFPKEWYWRRGRLTNDIDGDVEFLYLHFMHWKGGEWPRACGNAQWERLERLVHFDPALAHEGFRINECGFFSLGSSTVVMQPARCRTDIQRRSSDEAGGEDPLWKQDVK